MAMVLYKVIHLKGLPVQIRPKTSLYINVKSVARKMVI